MQMIDNSMDVHGRARKKRQQAILAAPADGGGNEIQVGETAFAAAPADDQSSAASSLFSHEEGDQLKASVGDSINVDQNQDAKQPAKEDKDESSVGSLFSSSSVQLVGTVKPILPPTITINALDSPAGVSAVTGFQDDSSCCSLFSNDREASDGDKCNNQQNQKGMPTALSTPSIEKAPTKPVYLTFDRPSYKADEESDIESSEDGSVFSLNEHDDVSPSPRMKSNLKQNAKKTSTNHQISLGTPAIPRKKSAAPSLPPVAASVPVKKDRTSRLCDKFARQPSQEVEESPASEPKKMKKRSKGRVSFAELVKQPKKYVGKSARAMKNAPPQAGNSCADEASTPPTKLDGEENIYFHWQKSSQEKAWNKEFVKVKKYLKDHGGNNDIPDGHSLSDWIRKQQNICKRWLRKSYELVGDISDKDFQTFGESPCFRSCAITSV
jgi:hypothetical protein